MILFLEIVLRNFTEIEIDDFESPKISIMFEKLIEHRIDAIIGKNSDKFVGTPANVGSIEFNIEQTAMRLPKFEKSNLITIIPVNR